ncbi:nitroreductase family protein [Microbulbifer sp. S227A]|uniref:nitroreductase family protein n=1 Tax=Microbulbifer sp. S227A TaxID=3415131 RepID=UPI003C7ABBB5
MTLHPVIADLATRKTSKRYDPTRRVTQDKLDVLYEALRLTASSINSQPWKFIVVDSEPAKRRLESTFARKNPHNRKHVADAHQVILMAHNPAYSRDDFAHVVDQDLANGRGTPAERDAALSKYSFAETKTDANGKNGVWTMAQVYIALGNALHTLARLGVDGTPMEGIDPELISEVFAQELDGYVCEVALVVGYHHPEDRNSMLPKSRLPLDRVLRVI